MCVRRFAGPIDTGSCPVTARFLGVWGLLFNCCVTGHKPSVRLCVCEVNVANIDDKVITTDLG